MIGGVTAKLNIRKWKKNKKKGKTTCGAEKSRISNYKEGETELFYPQP